MFNKLKQAFQKKKRPNGSQSFQMEEKIHDIPPIQKASTTDFQIIDEEAMQSIEQKYQAKNKSNSFNQEEQDQQIQNPFENIPQLMEYIVQEDDSLYGIALKFSVNHDYLMHINDLSSDLIFKGQIIQVPATNEPRYSVVKLPDQQQQQQQNIWEKQNICKKFDVVYCSSKQNVSGQITLTNDVVLFDPNELQIQQFEKGKSKTRFNACISMLDINEAVYYSLPNINGQYDYLVQIMLSGIGKPKFQKKYQKQLQAMKQQKRSIATIFLRHSERDREGKLYSEEIKKSNCIFISKFISESCNDYKEEGQLTTLPYIDLIDSKKQKLEIDEIQDVVGERMGRLWASLDYTPQLKQQSNCFTNTHYKQLVEQIPPVFRLAEWVKIYTIDNDGSSYENMLLEIKRISPLIIIIQDIDQKIFGAYLSTELQKYQLGFKGNGETFIFNIETNKNEVKSYFWTEKNNDFIFCDESGFGFGCGEKFGIFVDQSLTYGYSNPCETFDNPQLTLKEKFIIKHLEIWGIQNY